MDRESLRTEEAAAACYRKWDNHPITAAEISYRGADFLDYSHKLVTHDQRLGLREKSIVNVQVGSTNRRGGDFQDDVPRILQGGILDGFNAHVVWLVEDNGFHSILRRSLVEARDRLVGQECQRGRGYRGLALVALPSC